MQCKYFKLTNGDDIIASVSEQNLTFMDGEFLDLNDPVLISSVRIPRGAMVIETLVMQPWVKMSRTVTVKISTKNILAAVDLQQSAIDQYKEYVKGFNDKSVSDNDNFFSESTEMENIQETLEDFIEKIEEDMLEDEYYDDYPRNSDGRTIH